MGFISIGFGQTCSSLISPRWWARTSFIPSIRSAPKVVFLVATFLGHYIAILSDESMRGYSGSIFVSGTTVLFRSPSAKVTNGADFLYFSMSTSGRITIAQFVTSNAKIR